MKGRCWPWAHDWDVRYVSVPLFDLSAKGILKRCRRCPKVRAL